MFTQIAGGIFNPSAPSWPEGTRAHFHSWARAPSAEALFKEEAVSTVGQTRQVWGRSSIRTPNSSFLSVEPPLRTHFPFQPSQLPFNDHPLPPLPLTLTPSDHGGAARRPERPPSARPLETYHFSEEDGAPTGERAGQPHDFGPKVLNGQVLLQDDASQDGLEFGDPRAWQRGQRDLFATPVRLAGVPSACPGAAPDGQTLTGARLDTGGE